MNDSTHPANAETTTGSGATLNRSATGGNPLSEGIDPKSHPDSLPTSPPSYFEAVFGDLRSVSLSHRILASICLAGILGAVVYVVVQLKKEESYRGGSPGEFTSRFEYPAPELENFHSELLSGNDDQKIQLGNFSTSALKEEIRLLEEEIGKEHLESDLIAPLLPKLPDSAEYGVLQGRVETLRSVRKTLQKIDSTKGAGKMIPPSSDPAGNSR